jgi:hypothetical protein
MAGSTLRDNVSGLNKPRRGNKDIVSRRAAGAILPKVGVGKPVSAAKGGSQYPTAYAELNRSFHTTVREYRSTDGLFVILYNNIKTINTDYASFSYLDFDPSL